MSAPFEVLAPLLSDAGERSSLDPTLHLSRPVREPGARAGTRARWLVVASSGVGGHWLATGTVQIFSSATATSGPVPLMRASSRTRWSGTCRNPITWRDSTARSATAFGSHFGTSADISFATAPPDA